MVSRETRTIWLIIALTLLLTAQAAFPHAWSALDAYITFKTTDWEGC